MVKVKSSLFLDNSEAGAQPQQTMKCGVYRAIQGLLINPKTKCNQLINETRYSSVEPLERRGKTAGLLKPLQTH